MHFDESSSFQGHCLHLNHSSVIWKTSSLSSGSTIATDSTTRFRSNHNHQPWLWGGWSLGEASTGVVRVSRSSSGGGVSAQEVCNIRCALYRRCCWSAGYCEAPRRFVQCCGPVEAHDRLSRAPLDRKSTVRKWAAAEIG